LGFLERFPSSRVDACEFWRCADVLGGFWGVAVGRDMEETVRRTLERWGGGGVRAGADRGPVVSVSGASCWGVVLFTSLVLAFSGLDVDLVRSAGGCDRVERGWFRVSVAWGCESASFVGAVGVAVCSGCVGNA
jgi:hypothetical protein